MKRLSPDQEGFTLIETMIMVALAGFLFYGFGSAFTKNMRARKTIDAKLSYEDISVSLQSLFNEVLREETPSDCVSPEKFSQSGLVAGVLKSGAVGVAEAWMRKQIELPQNSFVKEAIERCAKPKKITDPSNASDSYLYFCSNLASGVGEALDAAQAFAEFRIELINSHTSQPLSCDAYRTTRTVAAKVFINLYWVNSQSPGETYLKSSRYYYVGK